MSGSSQVIRATQMFTKDGNSKKVSLVREIVTGFSLGMGFGLIWKTYHWNEKRKTEEYYEELASLPDKS
ncbi:g10936 [Coccomyxa viridis]|uniref:G10936 protein n=1 Tax=Coccomyxa viridis TaxID=1274662 RepID=A0ABP1G9D2_9CHLO